MIICVCNNVSDKQIKEKIKEGLNFDDLTFELNICNNCQKCKESIIELIKNNND